LGRSLVLEAAAWAAIVSADTAEQLGAAGAATEIPAALRRRLPPFSRDMMRCALPLLRDHPADTVIASGTRGDLDSTVKLLTDLARGELLSPALFAFSVHNAPAGALSLCLKPTGDHTALAGAEDAFAAALTEAYARLAIGEAQSVLVVHAEARDPEFYEHLGDHATPGVFLAVRVTRAADEAGAHNLAPARAGLIALAHAFSAGATRIRFSPPSLRAAAA
jgi:hypothetical protein